jgi:hypothetical protein
VQPPGKRTSVQPDTEQLCADNAILLAALQASARSRNAPVAICAVSLLTELGVEVEVREIYLYIKPCFVQYCSASPGVTFTSWRRIHNKQGPRVFSQSKQFTQESNWSIGKSNENHHFPPFTLHTPAASQNTSLHAAKTTHAQQTTIAPQHHQANKAVHSHNTHFHAPPPTDLQNSTVSACWPE